MGNNQFLTNARKNKRDEFYTQYSDVEREVKKFLYNFIDKKVYCPCDNKQSNFVKYFKDNFFTLKLKKLYYSSIDGNAYVFDGIKETMIYEGGVSILDKRYKELLDISDIVVTNPPFSLFIPFIDFLSISKKDFLIIGNQNSISCKTIFEHIKNDGVNVDYGFKGLAGHFYKPDDYDDYATAKDHKENMIRVSGVIWYTTFLLKDINCPIPLTKSCLKGGLLDISEYPTYDNFRKISGLNEDCININKVRDIPYDWNGYMGVPISFMGKYCPEQFEIIQLDHYGPLGNLDNVVNGKTTYRRIYIKPRNSSQETYNS